MPYDVELSDDAAATLARLPVDVVICVSNYLAILSADPIGLGRPARFPYRPVGQIYEFWCDTEGAPLFLAIFFHYVAGEQVMRVFAIGHR